MSDEYLMSVGGETINLAASGKTQLVRLAKATKFIDIYGKSSVKALQTKEGESPNMIELLISFLGGLDEDGLLMIGEIVSGKDKKFVETHFDLDWIMDGVSILLETPAFRKLRERFFGNQG